MRKQSSVELRLRDHSKLEAILPLAKGVVQRISIGDEGCVHRLPDQKSSLNAKRRIEESGFEFGFVTPKITEESCETVLRTIDALTQSGDDYSLTVNDTGLLYAIRQHHSTPKNVYLGRSMARSIQDCPWPGGTIFSEVEKEQFRMQSSMWDGIKIEFFKEYGVVGIESNQLETDDSSLTRIRGLGMKISLHAGAVAATFARACPTARHHKAIVPNCTNYCTRPMNLELKKILRNRSSADGGLTAAETNFQVILLGNVIYRKPDSRETKIPEGGVDTIIVHEWLFSDTSSLAAALTKMNGGETR